MSMQKCSVQKYGGGNCPYSKEVSENDFTCSNTCTQTQRIISGGCYTQNSRWYVRESLPSNNGWVCRFGEDKGSH